VRIEHHELSIFAGPPTGPMAGANADAASPEPEEGGLSHAKPERCPICGSGEMLLLADAVAAASLNVGSLKDGLETGSYHLHCSTAGEWWVCGQSIRTG
jgi:hypothetical protein